MEVANAVKTLNDTVTIFEELNAPDVTKIPPALGSIEEMILKEEVKDYVQRKRMLKATVTKLYAIIWGQCSDGVQSLLRLYLKFEKRLWGFTVYGYLKS